MFGSLLCDDTVILFLLFTCPASGALKRFSKKGVILRGPLLFNIFDLFEFQRTVFELKEVLFEMKGKVFQLS